MSGYEKSPQYGGPPPSWREAAGMLAAILVAIATLSGAVWALRRLLVACGLV